jgi:hypothetical protein
MNIARIKDVSFYVGLTENVQACWDMKKFLVDNGIDFKLLAYLDDSAHPAIFEGMNTWTWGLDGEKRTLTRFPILTWQIFDEDFNSHLECAVTIEEVKTKLLPHQSFIKN